jgi:hypothetical protein
VIDLTDEDDTIYIVGTRGSKVTKISGLENMKKLAVSSDKIR